MGQCTYDLMVLYLRFIKEEEMQQMGATPAWIGKGIVVAYA